jgi:putative CocE/NonD family hydrolase
LNSQLINLFAVSSKMPNDISNHPVPRSFLGQLFDRIVSWLVGFPSERCSYTTLALGVPIFDGLSRIELCANLLQPLLPNSAKPLGTVLVRSPYGRGFPIAGTARAYAARGYQVLVVSSRGTFGSGGDFDPFRTEAQDGQAIVEWMRKQTWYTGTFATMGGSYLGYVQWALLVDPPKDMVAAVPGVSPHNFARAIRGTGAMDLDIVKWADMVAHQEEPFSIWEALRSTRSRKMEAVLKETGPLARNIHDHLGGRSPWLDITLAKPDTSDPYYGPMKLERALHRADIPILIITGWYDLFLEQSMEQYLKLKERGCNVALTVGPWTHMKSGLAPQMSRHGFDWIEEHLAASKSAKRTVPVQYYITGAQEWREVDVFPPPTTPVTFYLHGGGRLDSKLESTSCPSSTFAFDPRDPTPTVGGNGLTTIGGSVDDSILAKRKDVLVFDTAPLETDFEICGQTTIELAHSTSSPFADVFVRISEVDAKGKSRNITEIYKRLNPEREIDKELKLSLNHCAHRVLRGKRIRVIVAGGCFPQYARNHGVENGDMNATEMRAVEHIVHHNEHRVSKLVLPSVTKQVV